MDRLILLLAAVMVLAGGCDRPAPITVGREEPPKPEKESFSGFQTSGTPFPLSQTADPRVADEPSATPVPSIAPEAEAAMQDYAKAVRDLRSDPAVHPPDSLDVIENPSAFQNMNNAIIGHMQQIEDAQDRARAAMNPQQRKAWATKKKEIDEGE